MYFFSLPLAMGPIQPPIQWVPWAFPLGLKQLGHKADHPSPSGAKVKSAWSYMSTPQ
jgi:hypothetical protein